MPLSHDIVIVNQFSLRTPSGRGTRGRTPGAYIERYMARHDAIETLAPVRLHDMTTYVERYMARDDAVEAAGSRRELFDGLDRADGHPRAGVAFGPDSISLSSDDVHERSLAIQDAFDRGKTVLKTVISFDTGYLSREGVLEAGFRPYQKGDLKGHVDQLKLRRAIMNGMRRLSRHFDDLQWVGVIQVDTMHVHCHIAAVDMGVGRLRSTDGRQSGIITPVMRDDLRHGIDIELEREQSLRFLSASVGYDRQQARTLVKRYAQAAMQRGSVGQFLLACLPDDRRHWRAGSNAKDMRKANAVCERWLRGVFEREPEIWEGCQRSVRSYAARRREREGLSKAQEAELVRKGERRVIEDCMNGVYHVLRQVPKRSRRTETATLDLMSMDLHDMASTDDDTPMRDFGVRLRGYSTRLRHHREERDRYHELGAEWDRRREQNAAIENSAALRALFREEEEYNEALMCKYLHFLQFMPYRDEYEDELEECERRRRRAEALEAMAADDDMRYMDPMDAEAWGRTQYGEAGGRMVLMPDAFARRVRDAERDYHDALDALRYRLEAHALTVVEGPDGLAVRRGVARPFEDVKALDIHHLGYDFPLGCDIGTRSARQFVAVTRRRRAALDAAEAYLASTGQTLPGLADLEADVTAMQDCAARIARTHHLDTMRDHGVELRRVRTTSLDVDLTRRVTDAVRRIAEDSLPSDD